MGKWDDLRKIFEEQEAAARKETERASQKRELVVAHAEAMWRELLEEGDSAVKEVNSGRETLMFVLGDPVLGEKAFEIASMIGGKHRRASAKYDSKTHTLTIKEGSDSRKFTLNANNNNDVLWYDGNNGGHTGEDIVRQMLVSLIRT